MSTSDDLKELLHQVRSAPVQNAPEPWILVGTYFIGGLTDIGFGDDSDLLLLLSADGRGVFDCQTGERLARDRTKGDYFQPYALTAEGIGPLGGQTVRTSGLQGGGLPQSCRSGWSVDIVAEWPDQHYLLFPPKSSLYRGIHGRPDEFTKLATGCETNCAWGFSSTSRILVLATSGELTIWRLGSWSDFHDNSK